MRWRFSVLSSNNHGQHDHHVLLQTPPSRPLPLPLHHHNQTQTLHSQSPLPKLTIKSSQFLTLSSSTLKSLSRGRHLAWPIPITMAELLIPQFSLDKLYFTPLGNFMDERDAAIREKLDAGRKKLKVEAELQEAMISLEQQKEKTIKVLDSQIAALCQDIVKKVLPTA